MSRSCANIPVLSYTETVIAYRVMDPLGLGSEGQGFFQVPWPFTTYPSGLNTYVHSFALVITSANETYSDTNTIDSGGAPGCIHYPWDNSSTAYITETWTYGGATHDTSRSISWQSAAALYGFNKNTFKFFVIASAGTSHVLSGVTVLGHTAQFNAVSTTYTAPTHIKLLYVIPNLDVYGTCTITFSASPGTMSCVTSAVATSPTGSYYDNLVPQCGGSMGQWVTSDCAFEVIFKPTDEAGNVLSIPCKVNFDDYIALVPGGGTPYVVNRTSPVDETFTFTGECVWQGIESHRYNAQDDSIAHITTYWPPGGWLGPYGSGLQGTYRNQFTSVRVSVDQSYIATPHSFDPLAFAELVPPITEQYVRHWWHPAAASTHVNVGHATLPSSIPLSLVFAQVGSVPGASVSGATLTAASSRANFRVTFASHKSIAPMRWVKFEFTASAAGNITIEFSGDNYSVAFADVGTPAQFVIAATVGANSVWLDLCGPPNLLTPTYENSFVPIGFLINYQLAFSNNVVTVTGVTPQVRYSAEFRHMGGGRHDGSAYTPFYGQCDGNPCFHPVTNPSGSTPVTLASGISDLSDWWGMTLSSIVTIPPVSFLTTGYNSAGVTCNYAAAYDSSGARSGSQDPVAGINIYWTAYHSKLRVYPGISEDSMFGGAPFKVRTEFMLGGVVHACTSPPAADPFTVQSGVKGSTPQVWADHDAANSIGYVRASYAHPVNDFGGTFSNDLYWTHFTSNEFPNGGAAVITPLNRGYGVFFTRGFPLTDVNTAWSCIDKMGRHHVASVTADGNIFYQRSDSILKDAGWAVAGIFPLGDLVTARMIVDPATMRIHLLATRLSSGTYSVWHYYSDSDGADFSAGDLIVTNAYGGSPWVSRNSSIGYTWFEYASGSSGPGVQKARFSEGSGQAFGLTYVFEDHTGAPIAVKDGGFSNVVESHVGANYLVWTPTIDGTSLPTVLYSSDNGHTWG